MEEKILIELEIEDMPSPTKFIKEDNLSINKFPKVGKCIVACHLLEGENIPHFHITGDHFYCAIRLRNPDYFIHGKYKDKLNGKQKEKLIEWLNQPYKKGKDETNWNILAHAWIKQFGEKSGVNEEVPPDYDKLNIIS